MPQKTCAAGGAVSRSQNLVGRVAEGWRAHPFEAAIPRLEDTLILPGALALLEADCQAAGSASGRRDRHETVHRAHTGGGGWSCACPRDGILYTAHAVVFVVKRLQERTSRLSLT